MALMYAGTGGQLFRGVCIGEHWEFSQHSVWQNRFVQKNLGGSNGFPVVKDYFFFDGTSLTTASLPDILQKETIFFFWKLLFLNLFVPGGSGSSDAPCRRRRAAPVTASLLSSSANYSPSQGCAGPIFAPLCGTEMDISGSSGDQSPI